ncbi:MAG TPA: hypothetical protein VGQ81_12170 [Acidobacteriota bacterium]|nr:hypothetical protein [Acidobacteriota bacterium]
MEHLTMWLANRSVKLKLGVFFLAAAMVVAFTAEYRHLIEESAAHLYSQADAQGKTKPSHNSHRCHNCVTSQPQVVTASWVFQPGFLVFAVVAVRQDRNPAALALFQLPAKRAPPLS